MEIKANLEAEDKIAKSSLIIIRYPNASLHVFLCLSSMLLNKDEGPASSSVLLTVDLTVQVKLCLQFFLSSP